MSDVSTAADVTAPAPEPTSGTEADVTRNLNVPEETTQETAPEGATTEELDEEIEFDGERFKVPKKLKDGFLMQTDYTKKTQGLAEERKGLEADREQVRKGAEAALVHAKDVGRVILMNEQLAQYDNIDWNTLRNDDPFRANELFQSRMILKEQRDGLAAQVHANEQRRSHDAQQDFAKRYEDTNTTLAKDIKGWNQETANTLAAFAKANGATDSDIRTLAVNAPLVKLLHKAWLGEQVLSKQRAAAKTAEPKVEAKPLTKVSGAGRASVNIYDTRTDMDSYVAERKKQGYGKR